MAPNQDDHTPEPELDEIRRSFAAVGQRLSERKQEDVDGDPSLIDRVRAAIQQSEPAAPAPPGAAAPPAKDPDEAAAAPAWPRWLGLLLAFVAVFGLGLWLGRGLGTPAAEPEPSATASSAAAPPARNLPAGPVTSVVTSVSVPQACLETARAATAFIDLLTDDRRDPRKLAVAGEAYERANERCRQQAGP